MAIQRIEPQPVWGDHEPTRIIDIDGGFIDHSGHEHIAPPNMNAAIKLDGEWYWTVLFVDVSEEV